LFSLIYSNAYSSISFLGSDNSGWHDKLSKTEVINDTKGKEIEQNEKQSKSRPILIGCGITVIALVFAFVALIIWLGSSDNSGVKMANEMDEYALEYISENNLLNKTEELICYYDVTISLDGTEAAILTTERVLYHKDNRTSFININDIDDVNHRYEDFVGDIIEIRSKSGTILKIEISPLNQGISFYNSLIFSMQSLQEEID